MKVIDLSAWQEDVNWQMLIDEKIEGVILKLGERDSLDEMFVDHVNNAVEYGLKYGVYYYAHASSEAEARIEAEFVDKQIRIYLNGKNPELGIWYDAEDDAMKEGDVTATCNAFICALNEKCYTYVGIYSSYNWLSNGIINVSLLAEYVPYWVAQYYHTNDFKEDNPSKIVRIWQYTDHYSDDLPYDCNVYYREDHDE